MVTKNISVFSLKPFVLYFKAMPNSIDFYKGVFLHVILIRTIVPLFDVGIRNLAIHMQYSNRSHISYTPYNYPL